MAARSVVLELALVGLGGAAGTAARALLQDAAGDHRIWMTAAINVVGSFLLGALVGRLASLAPPRARRWRVLLGTGVLGGFTTYSAFALDVVEAAGAGRWAEAVLHPALLVPVGVTAAWAGLVLARQRRRGRRGERAGGVLEAGVAPDAGEADR